jgi:hypothetical protein
MMSASVFSTLTPGIADIGVAYRTLIPALGAGAAGIFLVSLIVGAARVLHVVAQALLRIADVTGAEVRRLCLRTGIEAVRACRPA